MRICMFPIEIRQGDRFVWKGKTEWIALADAVPIPAPRGEGVECRVWHRREGEIVRTWRRDDRILIDRSPRMRERSSIGIHSTPVRLGEGAGS